MKGTLFIICHILLMPYICGAQLFRFETTANNYQVLSGGNIVPQEKLWRNYEYTIPVGFTFNIVGKAIDSIDISDVGAIRFRTYSSGFPYVYLFWGYGASIFCRNQDTAQSQISYLTTGSSGSRILKIEYKNCAFLYDGISQDSINFQIWLKESDYSIETHIGPSYSSNPSSQYLNGQGPAIGIMNGTDNEITTYAYMLTGSPQQPSTASKCNIYHLPCLSSAPEEGKVYRFSPAN
jgi:hypothetical protein